MPDPARTPSGLTAVGFLVAFSLTATAHAAETPRTHPVVAGFERFADDTKTAPVEAGRVGGKKPSPQPRPSVAKRMRRRLVTLRQDTENC